MVFIMNNSDLLLKLKRKNLWWQSPLLIEEDEKLKELASLRYPYRFPEISGIDLGMSGIYTIRGLRQIGKSTAIKGMIRSLLLEEKVAPGAVFYFSCDGIHSHEVLFEVIDAYLSEVAPQSGQLFIFIDEITFVEEWQRAVKELADEGRLARAAVVMTGSNMIDLKRSAELLPGRRGKAAMHDVQLHPLGFGQFVRLIDPALGGLTVADALGRIGRFQELFDHYLLCGGIPQAVNVYFEGGLHSLPPYIYEIYRSWILGDILKARKSEAVFESIVAYLLKSLTTPVSWYKLGKESHLVSHSAAMDYVELLERMFVLLRLEMIDPSSRRPVFRKNKKIYFADPLIHDALRALVDGFTEESWASSRRWIDDAGNLAKKVEQAVMADLCREHGKAYYWAGEKEMDAAVKVPGGRLDFHEVKYQGRVSASEFSWFPKVFPGAPLTVYTRRDFENAGPVRCVPVCLALSCGVISAGR